jgi:hypothetical protein
MSALPVACLFYYQLALQQVIHASMKGFKKYGAGFNFCNLPLKTAAISYWNDGLIMVPYMPRW